MSLEHQATRRSLLSDMRRLGIRKGDVVMIHAAVSKLGPILGGVTTLVQSLIDAVGNDGTIAAYVDWETGFEPYVVDPALADEIPIFDKRVARAVREYGILPEVIRGWPGSIRSDNPDAGVAAVGARADWLCANHALSYGYGDESPYAKLVAADARILVLGAPLDTITLLHHSEHVAELAGKRKKRFKRKMLVDGTPQWVDIEEFDTSDPVVDGMPADHFAQIAALAIAQGLGSHGKVGAADAHLFNASALHRIAVSWLEAWRPLEPNDLNDDYPRCK